LHGSKVITRDELIARPWTGLARGRLVIVDDERIPAVVVTHGSAAGGCGCFDTAELSNAREQVPVELERLFRFIAKLAGIHDEVDHVIWIESQIGMLGCLQAASEESCNNQQDQRASYLDNDQSCSQTCASARDTAPALVQDG